MGHTQKNLLPDVENCLSSLSGAFDLMRYAPSIGMPTAFNLIHRIDNPPATDKLCLLGIAKGMTAQAGYFAPVAHAFTLLSERALDESEARLLNPSLALAGVSAQPVIPPLHIFNTMTWGVVFHNMGGNTASDIKPRLRQGMVRLYESNNGAVADTPPLECILQAIDAPVERAPVNPNQRLTRLSKMAVEDRLFMKDGFEPLRRGAAGYVQSVTGKDFSRGP